ncbi:hypothetical protein NKG95_06290 [Mesorhizobium sp. M1423]|uniref:hypothetical protein n=1 Tax=unclassified Mesorhizobium TaxID=325217 RepID=UPI00041B26EC
MLGHLGSADLFDATRGYLNRLGTAIRFRDTVCVIQTDEDSGKACPYRDLGRDG